MVGILRGDIVWPDLARTRRHLQAGLRPVLILSEDVFNQRSGTVIAIALTSQPQRAGFFLTLKLQSPKLPKQSWSKISQVRTLSVQRLKKKIGKASPVEMDAVVDGLNELIGGQQSPRPYR